jgi:hypothetical protein
MRRVGERAALEIHEKLTSPKKLVREIKVWRVPSSVRYPDGVKYRMVLVNPQNGEVLLLFDNHWPKGHHFHAEGREGPIAFSGVKELLLLFIERSNEAERRYHEN